LSAGKVLEARSACVLTGTARRSSEVFAPDPIARQGESSMNNSTLVRAALIGAALAVTAPAFAQALPAPQTQNGVSFITGGAGRDKVEAFRQAAGDFNLRATFSQTDGAFIANVNVELRDAQGKTLVTTKTEGPFFFAKVPPGTYEMVATYGDQTQRRQLVVNAGGAATTDVSFRPR
jgi:hypothetical protein